MSNPVQDDFDRIERMLDMLSRLRGLQDALEDAVEPVLDHVPPDRQRMIDALMQAGRDQRAQAEAEAQGAVAALTRDGRAA